MKWLLVLLLLTLPPHAANANKSIYEANLLEVIDGDTIRVNIPLWNGLSQTTLIRVKGIDAPEINGKCPHLAKTAKAAAQHFLKKKVWLDQISNGKYSGRLIARVNHGEFAHLMITAQLAIPYTGGSRSNTCQKLKRLS